MKNKILTGILLIFLSVSLFAQTPIFTSGMAITGFNSVNAPAGEPLVNTIDGTNNKFLDFDEFDGMGFSVDLGGLSRIATSIEVTTANDSPGRDPQTYEVFGSTNGIAYTSLATGAIPCVATRLFARTFNFANATAYTYYRINFATRCGTDSEMQVAEVQLYEPTVNMSYVSSTTTQNNTTGISICGGAAANQEIIGIEVVTTGYLNPLTLERIRFQTNGSTDPLNDISNVDIYYTGTSPVFATTTLYGSSAPQLNNVNIPINTNQILAQGVNYFWVVYDVPATATIGNNLDALCNRVILNGINYVPTITDPAGDRPIAGCPGDEPCTAYSITVGCSGVKVAGDNTGMTNSGITNPSCGTYSGGDVWYSLIVPASGVVKVESYAGTLSDVAMSIYSVSGSCSSTFTQLACDDNSGFGNIPKVTLAGQTPGSTLYVRVWDNGNNQSGTFEIDASDLNSDYCVTGDGTDLGSGCAQLTSAVNDELGSIWDADDKLSFTSSWTYDFTVNLGSDDSGVDGICFVIQNGPNALATTGASGGSMGSGGIANSLIVEIDTYLNTEDRNDGLIGPTCAGGTNPDHMDIWLNGDVNPGDCNSGTRYIPNAVNLMNGGSDYNIENGLDHILRVSYTLGTQTLTATTLNAAGTITYGTVSYSTLDPMVVFGTNAPYFGFTASTGGLNNNQSTCLPSSFILPIELIAFEVACIVDKVELVWKTSTEINNDYYTIERSVDGVNFEEIDRVLGAGNSDQLVGYVWVDDSPLVGSSYYRLKQTDFDGEFSYSSLKSSNCQEKPKFGLYPNPFLDIVKIEFESESEVQYQIIAMDGRVLREGNFVRNISVDLAKLSSGVYFMRAISKDEIFQEKLIKK